MESKTAIFVVVTRPPKLLVLTLKRAARYYAIVYLRYVHLSLSTRVRGFFYILCGRSCFLSPAIQKFSLVTDCEVVRLGINRQLTACSISCDFKHTNSYALVL